MGRGVERVVETDRQTERENSVVETGHQHVEREGEGERGGEWGKGGQEDTGRARRYESTGERRGQASPFIVSRVHLPGNLF